VCDRCEIPAGRGAIREHDDDQENDAQDEDRPYRRHHQAEGAVNVVRLGFGNLETTPEEPDGTALNLGRYRSGVTPRFG
jgi:hypothetical protein